MLVANRTKSIITGFGVWIIIATVPATSESYPNTQDSTKTSVVLGSDSVFAGEQVEVKIIITNTTSYIVSEHFSDTCIFDLRVYSVYSGGEVLFPRNRACGEALTHLWLDVYKSRGMTFWISTAEFNLGDYVVRGGLVDLDRFHPWGEARLTVLKDTLSN